MFSTVSKLPTTAYIKMIDWWLILSLLKPFVDIIFHTVIESLRYELIDCKVDTKETKQAWMERTETQRKIMKKIKYLKIFLQMIYPTIHLILIILFWIIGLTAED